VLGRLRTYYKTWRFCSSRTICDANVHPISKNFRQGTGSALVENALSIDKLKQQIEGATLRNFFKQQWPDKADFNKATTNFVQSLAAYSLVCYFLQIKDRHNGNIMMDDHGNLLHIDFGYLLTRTIEFEKAPFKLTEEFIDIIGGEKSKLFARYEDLCVQGFFCH